MSVIYKDGLRATIRENLYAFDRRTPEGVDLTPAAVAFVIVGNEEGEASFILTRRISGLRNHGGQWSLPGGRVEPGEDAITTALRELEEEVGIALGHADVLGFLDDFPTRSGFLIKPLVAWGPERVTLRPDPREVAAAYLVPVAALMAPSVPRIVPGPEPDRPLVTIPLDEPETIVYAPTAALLYQAREVALRGRPTRVEGFGEPTWAWK